MKYVAFLVQAIQLTKKIYFEENLHNLKLQSSPRLFNLVSKFNLNRNLFAQLPKKIDAEFFRCSYLCVLKLFDYACKFSQHEQNYAKKDFVGFE